MKTQIPRVPVDLVSSQESTRRSNRDAFSELTQLIKEQGLLDRQPVYYTFKIVSTLAMLALSITFLAVVDIFWLQLLNAAFLAFVFGQIGFVGHDAGHLGIFRSVRGNQIIGLSVNFLISLSRTWWVTQHNQHHRTPNDLDQDPHTLIPILAFSEEKALRKRGPLRFMIRYQAFYFGPILALESMGIRLASTQFLLQLGKLKYILSEIPLMGLHFAVYFGLLFYFLTPGQVLAFTLVNQGLFGLYYGTVFAPNHKGMLILEKNNKLDFLRTQVLTTRNVRPNLFADFWYGGLNYQIEHHLFPMMPRKQLGKARIIIQAFCRRQGISYHETGTFQSYKEILSYMHRVSAPLRQGSGWEGKPQKALEEGLDARGNLSPGD